MGKVKIHEIAKKLGLGSKEVVEKAIELGIDVKSHMSSISEEDAKKLEGKFSGVKKENKEVKEKKDTPVIIRREVIVSDLDTTNKKEIKQETKKTTHDVGFIERDRKKDYNIVYRNKPNRPLTVSELFGTKKPETPKTTTKSETITETTTSKKTEELNETQDNNENKVNTIPTQPTQKPYNINRTFNKEATHHIVDSNPIYIIIPYTI